LTHEVALALSMPVVSADNLMWLAWDLQVRLSRTYELLADGVLTLPKVKAVYEAFLLLSDENAARAEALILPHLPGKTLGQIKQLAAQAAITVDPEAAARRREHAERENSRVTIFREDSGAVALCGRDLPTVETLAAHARVCALARQYKDSGAFPADIRMDQFRVVAYLDLLNGRSAEARIAAGRLDDIVRTADTEVGAPEADATESNGPEEDGPKHDGPAGPRASGRPDDDEPGGDGPGGGPGGGSPGSLASPAGGGSPTAAPPRLVDLVLPLATLLGLANRPGEGHALGPLDPDLCRALADAAVGSPWTRLCVTVTDPQGVTIAHGCARPPRNVKAAATARSAITAGSALALPSQMNLTITADRLAELAEAGPLATPRAAWRFTRAVDSGPPGGFGTWTLTLPGGRRLTCALEPVPTFNCDHSLESRGYHPSDRLRHLTQVRDYVCTFPTCNRHAKESDWDHARPYHRGGTTCGCNGSARSRACHRVKQPRGWQVTQPRPGWARWETPTGRVYTQGPKRYPT
jgi:hypothetical protein